METTKLQEVKMKKQIIAVLILAMFFIMPIVMAVEFDTEPSDADKATFDQILEPIMKIYNLVKYVASAIAGLALLFAGVTYMISGSDPKKRDNAKAMAMYVVIGLVVIWAAPLVVQFITS